MKKLGFEDGKEDDLENQYKTLSANVDNLSDKVNALTSRSVHKLTHLALDHIKMWSSTITLD